MAEGEIEAGVRPGEEVDERIADEASVGADSEEVVVTVQRSGTKRALEIADGKLADGANGAAIANGDHIELADEEDVKRAKVGDIDSGEGKALEIGAEEKGGREGAGAPFQRKVDLPVRKYPDIDFVAVILGEGEKEDRSAAFEEETGAKVEFFGIAEQASWTIACLEEIEQAYVLISADSGERLEKGFLKVRRLLADYPTDDEPAANGNMEASAGQSVPPPASGAPPSAAPPAVVGAMAVSPTGAVPTLATGEIGKPIFIPNSRVGLVIGKGGETIKTLQQMSGARIQVQRDAEADPNAPERRIELFGTPPAVDKAERLIREIVEQGPAAVRTAGQLTAAPAPGVYGVTSGPPGSDQVQMRIPNNKVGLVIGKSGETIKMLQERSGARIQIQTDRETDPGASERIVTLIGPKYATDEAVRLINEVALGAGPRALASQPPQAPYAAAAYQVSPRPTTMPPYAAYAAATPAGYAAYSGAPGAPGAYQQQAAAVWDPVSHQYNYYQQPGQPYLSQPGATSGAEGGGYPQAAYAQSHEYAQQVYQGQVGAYGQGQQSGGGPQQTQSGGIQHQGSAGHHAHAQAQLQAQAAGQGFQQQGFQQQPGQQGIPGHHLSQAQQAAQQGQQQQQQAAAAAYYQNYDYSQYYAQQGAVPDGAAAYGASGHAPR